MEIQTKNIIKALADQTFSDNKPFGQAMAHLMFPRNKRALLYVDGHYILLLPPDANATNEIKSLIELMSHLRYMETEHIIYVQNVECGDDHILYEGCDDMKKSSALQGYDLGLGCMLKEEHSSYSLDLNNGEKVLTQNVNIDFLANEIGRYIESRIFPTAAINQLIGHDYLSENDYNNHQALKFSRRSIWVALIIACLSPIVTLLLSNKWGKATINDTQFTTIIEKVDENNKAIDSLIILENTLINEQDTIKPLQGQR